jgi:hypothetical protein
VLSNVGEKGPLSTLVMFVSTEEPMEGSVGVKVTPVGPRRSRRAGPIHSVVVNLSFRI